MAAFGLCPGWRARTEFLATAFVAIATVLFGSLAALVLAVPGARHARFGARRWRWWRCGSAAVTAIVRGDHGFSAIADWPVCFLRVLLISLVPACCSSSWSAVRAVEPGWTAALAAMAALSTGAVPSSSFVPSRIPATPCLGTSGP
jgi:hypothetical protein